MSADPARTVSYERGALRIGGACIPTPRPFDVLRRELQAEPSESHPHFRSGFLGYFGYGLQHTLERLPAGPPDTTGLPALYGGDYSWSVVTDHTSATTTLWHRSDLARSDIMRIRRVLARPSRASCAAFPSVNDS